MSDEQPWPFEPNASVRLVADDGRSLRVRVTAVDCHRPDPEGPETITLRVSGPTVLEPPLVSKLAHPHEIRHAQLKAIVVEGLVARGWDRKTANVFVTDAARLVEFP